MYKWPKVPPENSNLQMNFGMNAPRDTALFRAGNLARATYISGYPDPAAPIQAPKQHVAASESVALKTFPFPRAADRQLLLWQRADPLTCAPIVQRGPLAGVADVTLCLKQEILQDAIRIQVSK